MDLSDLLASLGRRWWLTVLGIAATAFLVQYVYGIVPQTYESRASMVLLPPPVALDKTTNPYLGLSGLQAITDVLSRSMSDGAVHEELAPKGGAATLQVSRDTTAAGPMLVIDVTDTTVAGARDVLARTLDTAPTQLHKLQSSVGVAPGDEIRIVEVTRSIEPVASNKGQIRAVILAGVGGLAVTLFLVSLADNVLTRRSRRRAELVGTSEESDDEPHVGDRRPDGSDVEQAEFGVPASEGQVGSASPVPRARAPR